MHSGAAWLIGGIASDGIEFLNDAWYEESNGAGCVAPELIVHCDNEDNGLAWAPARKQQVRVHLIFDLPLHCLAR
jgi:hypothetical protein